VDMATPGQFHAASIRSFLRTAALFLLMGAAGLAAGAQEATSADVTRVIGLIDAGHFHEAQVFIDGELAKGHVSAQARDALAFQRERMRRILIDFTLDADAVKQRVRKQIPDLTTRNSPASMPRGCSRNR
jgi:hypothetical protein